MTPKIVITFLLLSVMPLSATINVKNFGAAGNGYTNDTAALNDAFSVGCATSQSVYVPTGTYIVDPLVVLSGCGTTFYGDGSSHSVLKFSGGGLTPPIIQSLWSFSGGAGKTLNINNIGLQGRHGQLAGLFINGYSNVNLRSLYINSFGTPGYAQGHGNPFDGIYLINSTNATLKWVTSVNNERYGIELQADHYTTVQNSTMKGNGSMGGVSEQNFDGPLDGPRVAKWLYNTLRNNGSGGIDVETDDSLPAVQGILQGNVVQNCGNNNWDLGWGLVLGEHAYGTISGNEVDNEATAYSFGAAWTNGIVYGGIGGPVSILNNTVRGTRTYGILGNEGRYYPVTISGNTVDSNGTGIFVYDSPSLTVTNNAVSNSAGAGISIYWSDPLTIWGNTFSNNNPDLLINGVQQ